MRRLHILAALIPLAVFGSFLVAGSSATNTATSIRPVMFGLDAPRGVAIGPHGAVYVAEAGRGGSVNCMLVRGVVQCGGATGRVQRVHHGKQEIVATGLPSHAPQVQPSFEGATGPAKLSFDGRTGWVAIGLGGEPAVIRSAFGDGFGHLVRLRSKGHWSFSTDISEHEERHNPDGGPVDSNPYGVFAKQGARLVTDAGGNDLLRVRHGSISTLAVFPSRPQGRATDAVPTAVTVGPDGAYYVSELTGDPFTVGAANIYRVPRGGGTPQVVYSGFTAINDLAFGCDRALYVLQIATGPGLSGPGALIRVGRNGSRTEIATGQLPRPGGLAIDCGKHKGDYRFSHDGDDDDDDRGGKKRQVIYVSINSTSIGTGQVVRIER